MYRILKSLEVFWKPKLIYNLKLCNYLKRVETKFTSKIIYSFMVQTEFKIIITQWCMVTLTVVVRAFYSVLTFYVYNRIQQKIDLVNNSLGSLHDLISLVFEPKLWDFVYPARENNHYLLLICYLYVHPLIHQTVMSWQLPRQCRGWLILWVEIGKYVRNGLVIEMHIDLTVVFYHNERQKMSHSTINLMTLPIKTQIIFYKFCHVTSFIFNIKSFEIEPINQLPFCAFWRRRYV